MKFNESENHSTEGLACLRSEVSAPSGEYLSGTGKHTQARCVIQTTRGRVYLSKTSNDRLEHRQVYVCIQV